MMMMMMTMVTRTRWWNNNEFVHGSAMDLHSHYDNDHGCEFNVDCDTTALLEVGAWTLVF